MRAFYHTVIGRVLELLGTDVEWSSRYARYAAKLADPRTEEQLRQAARMFKVPSPFRLYMPLSKVKQCGDRKADFELRYRGQSVAEIKVSGDIVSLKAKDSTNMHRAFESVGISMDSLPIGEWVDWQESEAAAFRKAYRDLDEAVASGTAVLKGQPEHAMESWLLENYARRSAEDKELAYIQPVRIPGTSACFQMPTPLRASRAKEGASAIEYSKQYGGGIDILARIGRGSGTRLAILELKDEFRPNEPPEKAVAQAIAYATFIRELLKSRSGQQWWHIFSFSGDLPAKLELCALVVMPNDARANKSFAEGGPLTIEHDEISLGYIYRETDNLPQEVRIG